MPKWVSLLMYVWMYGFSDGLTDGLVDIWLGELMDGWMDECSGARCIRIHGYTHVLMDE